MERSLTTPTERANADDDALRSDGDRVDALLAELSRSASPEAFARVEELVERIVGLYGSGLQRVLAHVMETGGWGDALASRLEQDELVSGLLALHHAHPVPAFERVDRALNKLRGELGERADVALLGLADDGVARVRITAGDRAPPRGELEEAVRELAVQAAPELEQVVFEHGAGGSDLVQIRLSREGR